MCDEVAEKYKKEVTEWLAKIGWTLRHCGCGFYRIFDQNDEFSGLMYHYDRIEVDRSHAYSVTAYLHGSRWEETGDEGDCITLTTANQVGKEYGPFIQMHNWHSKKEQPNEH